MYVTKNLNKDHGTKDLARFISSIPSFQNKKKIHSIAIKSPYLLLQSKDTKNKKRVKNIKFQ